jgi:hypothetical protein
MTRQDSVRPRCGNRVFAERKFCLSVPENNSVSSDCDFKLKNREGWEEFIVVIDAL